jgi:hypothetical protein
MKGDTLWPDGTPGSLDREKRKTNSRGPALLQLFKRSMGFGIAHAEHRALEEKGEPLLLIDLRLARALVKSQLGGSPSEGG